MNGKEFKREALRKTGNVLLPVVIAGLIKTLSIKKEIPAATEELLSSGKPYLLAFWHGNMLLAWYLHRGKKIMGLTSLSKDGDLLANLLKKWGYFVARGSSNKEGKVALGIMVDYLKHDGPVALTPDGPRGPLRELKPGVVVAAHRAGVPVVFAGVGFKKKRCLKSWDRFEIPALFTSAKVVYSDPFIVPAEADREALSGFIHSAQELLISVQLTAERGVE